MLPYFTEKFGNPSSIYSISSENKKAITDAREVIAKTINTTPENIYFTAGGSESDNWADVYKRQPEDHGWTGSVATFAKEKIEEVNAAGTYTSELITSADASEQIRNIEDKMCIRDRY